MTDIAERVKQFNTLQLPGQPMGMHMGTSNLVNDLWREVADMRDRLQEIASQCHNLPRGATADRICELTKLEK